MNVVNAASRGIPRAIPLIRVGATLPVVELLKVLGAPVESLWARVGLPVAALRNAEDLVPLPLALRFQEEAARSQGIDTLAFRAGRRAGLESIGFFGRAIRRSVTLFDAVRAARTLVGGHNSGARYWLADRGDQVALCRRFVGTGGSTRQGDLMTLALMIELVALVAGPDWRPTEVVLQSGGPPLQDAETLLPGTRIRMCGRATELVFPRELLARALPSAPRSLPPSASELRDWLLMGPPGGFVASARLLVGSLVEADRQGVDAAAQAAGMSLRTFQRRLAAASTSYSRLVDEVRLAGALRLLDDPSVKAVEVAYRLGYSDPAHFTRAFRRWTSLSPAHYRRLRRGEGPSPGWTDATDP